MGDLERAIEIALEAHRGQTDKAGGTYIEHPLRLMLRMESTDAKIVAVMHDVIEDSGWTADDLREEGFSERVVTALEKLTKRDGESYSAFIDRARDHQLARRVKRADLEDNMDITRLDEITDDDLTRLEKYHGEWRRLVDSD